MMKPPVLSIAICTHNPDRRTLARLLTAVRNLSGVSELEEIVLVDNNSQPRLDQWPEVSEFISQLSGARYCYEAEPGLSAARCRAIRETAADVIVFFDDDNEPESDYLRVLSGRFEKYPSVAVWGPGTIDVEFIDETADEIRCRKDIFQARRERDGFACIPGYYGDITPMGTGFAVRREVLRHYERLVTSGVLNLTGRNGKSMSSGEDTQIVWEAMKLGYATGVVSNLRCRHLINGAKANDRYIGRLCFGLAASHLPALAQCYPDLAQSMAYVPSLPFVWKRLFKLQVKHWIGRSSNLERVITQASLLGSAYGSAIVKNDPRSERFKSLSGFYGFS
jgi:glycosyltransferase involved in cell wall biosynthesis